MRITVINYTGDRANWGSQATSAELLKQLELVFPDPTFHLVPLRKSKLIDAIIAKLWGRKIEAALSRPTEKGDKLLARAARIIYQGDYCTALNADLVVFQPEGTMDGLRFTTGARLLLLPAALAAANRHLICLNGSAETKNPRFQPAMAGGLQRCRLVAMREPASARFLAELGIHGVRVIPDSAFMAEAAEENVVDLGGRRYLAVTGSAIMISVNWGRIWKKLLHLHRIAICEWYFYCRRQRIRKRSGVGLTRGPHLIWCESLRRQPTNKLHGSLQTRSCWSVVGIT